MTLDQIRYFVAAGTYQHVGKAARYLRISPSAVSHAIAALESELGQPLFTRDKKTLKLTAHGNYFLRHGSEILGRLTDLKNTASADTVEFYGLVRIAGTSSLVANFLAPLWAKVAARHPMTSVELVETRSPQVLSLVASGAVDLGICFSTKAPPNLQSKALRSGRIVLGARKHHPLAKLTGKALLKQLGEFPVCAARPLQMAKFGDDCDLKDLLGIESKRGVSYFDGYETARALLTQGSFWGAFPDWFLSQYSKELIVLDDKMEIAKYTMAAYWKKGSALAPPLSLLLESMEEARKATPKAIC